MNNRMILTAVGLLLTQDALAMSFEVLSDERLVYRFHYDLCSSTHTGA